MSEALAGTAEARQAGLQERFAQVREATERLAEPLSEADCTAQSMPDASPTKWHLAHTTWFFETFVLERFLPSRRLSYRPFDPGFRVLFNSYYNAVGEQYPRPKRGLISRPGLAEVLRYREFVDAQVCELLAEGGEADEEIASLVELGLHHEQQHQELVLTDLKHLLSHDPSGPTYRERTRTQPLRVDAPVWHAYPEGLVEIGHAGPGFAFDNECPRHRVFLEAFELASAPITNGEWRAFMEDGGYERAELWLAEGWAVRAERGWQAPLYWSECDRQWQQLTLNGRRPVRDEDPVCHVSYFEADAFATWRGARLPTEAEWEIAASRVPVAGNFVESGRLAPERVAEALAGDQPSELFGNCWEWTASPYVGYPRYRPPAGALGEYNGKFMCNQMVLRGGSCATPRTHIRATYRNFFPPDSRWQFSGLRLAQNPG